MTAPIHPVLSWSYKGGRTLYESRALTEMLCQRLVVRGWLDEVHEDDGCIRYRVNGVGLEEAAKLRGEANTEIYGFLGPTGR
jgi:hypothetical protein